MSEPRLCVPVTVGTCASTLRLFRTASGKRTAVAFSSPLKLAKVLGAGQQWVLLTAPALRGMIAELDVIGIVIDPAGTMTRPAKRVA
ncbi:SAV_915 family protein [Nonomuraea sp. NPDC049784]|uniref:SAV_915 family protein n=1 Tax=Nonomuraea sp. NPDC049784 TaxID=3154361 RepID=UPI0033EA5521